MDDEEISIESSQNISPDDVQKAFDAAQKKAEEVQELHIQAAQSAGYTKDALIATAPFYVQLARLSEDTPHLCALVNSGVEFAYSLKSELDQISEETKPVHRHLLSVSSSADTFVTSSGSAGLAIGIDEDLLSFESPPFSPPDKTTIEKQLSSIDPFLAATYREIVQVYHGTSADPSRAAIGLMRQVFDHFFGILAPNDAVRSSPCWKPKKDNQPDLVTRRERMTYAAHTHIRNKARRGTVIANIDNILETYQFLNHLHQRGALSSKQARIALKTMQKFIETWVDAMES